METANKKASYLAVGKKYLRQLKNPKVTLVGDLEIYYSESEKHTVCEILLSWEV